MKIITIIVVVFMITGCDYVKNVYEGPENKKLAITRNMPEQEIPLLGARCYFARTWREGRLYYIFKSESDKSESKRSEFFKKRLSNPFTIPTFTVQLNDKYGFKLLSIPMNDVVRINDDSNQTIRIEQRSDGPCSKEMYKSISTWDVVWR